jgi:hypothetical protein
LQKFSFDVYKLWALFSVVTPPDLLKKQVPGNLIPSVFPSRRFDYLVAALACKSLQNPGFPTG